MAKSTFGKPNNHLFGPTRVTNASSTSVLPPALPFSEFRFTTIGQGPTLLGRMSERNPSGQYGDQFRSSLTPSPDLQNEPYPQMENDSSTSENAHYAEIVNVQEDENIPAGDDLDPASAFTTRPGRHGVAGAVGSTTGELLSVIGGASRETAEAPSNLVLPLGKYHFIALDPLHTANNPAPHRTTSRPNTRGPSPVSKDRLLSFNSSQNPPISQGDPSLPSVNTSKTSNFSAPVISASNFASFDVPSSGSQHPVSRSPLPLSSHGDIPKEQQSSALDSQAYQGTSLPSVPITTSAAAPSTIPVSSTYSSLRDLHAHLTASLSQLAPASIANDTSSSEVLVSENPSVSLGAPPYGVPMAIDSQLASTAHALQLAHTALAAAQTAQTCAEAAVKAIEHVAENERTREKVLVSMKEEVEKIGIWLAERDAIDNERRELETRQEMDTLERERQVREREQVFGKETEEIMRGSHEKSQDNAENMEMNGEDRMPTIQQQQDTTQSGGLERNVISKKGLLNHQAAVSPKGQSSTLPRFETQHGSQLSEVGSAMIVDFYAASEAQRNSANLLQPTIEVRPLKEPQAKVKHGQPRLDNEVSMNAPKRITEAERQRLEEDREAELRNEQEKKREKIQQLKKLAQMEESSRIKAARERSSGGAISSNTSDISTSVAVSSSLKGEVLQPSQTQTQSSSQLPGGIGNVVARKTILPQQKKIRPDSSSTNTIAALPPQTKAISSEVTSSTNDSNSPMIRAVPITSSSLSKKHAVTFADTDIIAGPSTSLTTVSSTRVTPEVSGSSSISTTEESVAPRLMDPVAYGRIQPQAHDSINDEQDTDDDEEDELASETLHRPSLAVRHRSSGSLPPIESLAVTDTPDISEPHVDAIGSPVLEGVGSDAGNLPTAQGQSNERSEAPVLYLRYIETDHEHERKMKVEKEEVEIQAEPDGREGNASPENSPSLPQPKVLNKQDAKAKASHIVPVQNTSTPTILPPQHPLPSRPADSSTFIPVKRPNEISRRKPPDPNTQASNALLESRHTTGLPTASPIAPLEDLPPTNANLVQPGQSVQMLEGVHSTRSMVDTFTNAWQANGSMNARSESPSSRAPSPLVIGQYERSHTPVPTGGQYGRSYTPVPPPEFEGVRRLRTLVSYDAGALELGARYQSPIRGRSPEGFIEGSQAPNPYAAPSIGGRQRRITPPLASRSYGHYSPPLESERRFEKRPRVSPPFYNHPSRRSPDDYHSRSAEPPARSYTPPYRRTSLNTNKKRPREDIVEYESSFHLTQQSWPRQVTDWEGEREIALTAPPSKYRYSNTYEQRTPPEAEKRPFAERIAEFSASRTDDDYSYIPHHISAYPAPARDYRGQEPDLLSRLGDSQRPTPSGPSRGTSNGKRGNDRSGRILRNVHKTRGRPGRGGGQVPLVDRLS